ncbi:VG15 protein [Tsukamurella ocularis]
MTQPAPASSDLAVAAAAGAAGTLNVVAFQRAQAAIAQGVLTLTGRAMQRYGPPTTPAVRAQIVQRMLPTVIAARQASYEAGAAHLRHAARAAGAPQPMPAPIVAYTPDVLDEAIEAAVEKATPRKPRVRVTEVDPAALDQVSRTRPRVRVAVAATVAKHAQAAGRAVVEDTADALDEEVGWARVLTGAENCAFCVMLASRGPVYKTERTAQHRGRNQVDDTYHNNCDCVPTLVFKGRDWEGRERFEVAEDLWTEATKGYRQKAALNALRRQLARAEREGWSHQHLLDVLRVENAP